MFFNLIQQFKTDYQHKKIGQHYLRLRDLLLEDKWLEALHYVNKLPEREKKEVLCPTGSITPDKHDLEKHFAELTRSVPSLLYHYPMCHVVSPEALCALSEAGFRLNIVVENNHAGEVITPALIALRAGRAQVFKAIVERPGFSPTFGRQYNSSMPHLHAEIVRQYLRTPHKAEQTALLQCAKTLKETGLEFCLHHDFKTSLTLPGAVRGPLQQTLCFPAFLALQTDPRAQPFFDLFFTPDFSKIHFLFTAANTLNTQTVIEVVADSDNQTLLTHLLKTYRGPEDTENFLRRLNALFFNTPALAQKASTVINRFYIEEEKTGLEQKLEQHIEKNTQLSQSKERPTFKL